MALRGRVFARCETGLRRDLRPGSIGVFGPAAGEVNGVERVLSAEASSAAYPAPLRTGEAPGQAAEGRRPWRSVVGRQGKAEAPEKLALRGIVKSFPHRRGRLVALEEISLSVREGEFICLVGPSGCGKSTLLRLIAGLEKPDAGEISINGQAVDGPGAERAMVFQENALFPWLTVLGN
ncbi:MAG: ATP-binding cassette domain-containing protein, partial [Clostridia bacterium]|nr:ATP-binding cassette domain-containing protein [Clostridia bacterium]